MKLFVVYVPCYNEEDGIEPMTNSFIVLEKKLIKSGIQLNVVWINDFSNDSTAEKINLACANTLFFRSIHHSENRGLAGALETSLRDAGEQSPETLYAVGLLDGDNSHPPEFFEPMLEKLNLGYDLIVASRFQNGSTVEGVPYHRQLMSLVMSYLFRLAGRVTNIRDYSCGFRVYRGSLFQKISGYTFKKRSFACMVELLMVCDRQKAQCCEIPFTLRYDKKLSESKMRVWWTIRETLSVLFVCKSHHRPS
ncbi:glycosyltransferase family 2 protein [Bdellovibrio sp. HCB209]|uniref:glycosyltransferase family 2 protein n=1 Tax=Bdellovibrio sp. HCB209 TaxID=3394354 RepID=UPI0039B53C6F